MSPNKLQACQGNVTCERTVSESYDGGKEPTTEASPSAGRLERTGHHGTGCPVWEGSRLGHRRADPGGPDDCSDHCRAPTAEPTAPEPTLEPTAPEPFDPTTPTEPALPIDPIPSDPIPSDPGGGFESGGGGDFGGGGATGDFGGDSGTGGDFGGGSLSFELF